MSNSFFTTMIKAVEDEYTSLADDGVSSGEFTGFVDTGCYMLNAVLSGSIYGGVPNNRITGFAGETSTGKTFFILGVVKNFLDSNPNGGVVYYDTEAAVNKKLMQERGIDTARVIVAEPDTIQKFKTHALKMLDTYEKMDPRPPMMFVLDSLGMLSTSKEMEDSLEGKDTRDMTKSQVIKAAFRVLTLKLARLRVPMILSNHTYEVVGAYVPTKELSGGSGLKYAASSIALLSRRKEKDGTEVIGHIIKIKMYKSRLSRENKEAEVLLTYEKGLDKYYGLADLAEKYGIFKKLGSRYELPDGKKLFGKQLYSEPEQYFTKEVLDAIDVAANKEYKYGINEETQHDDLLMEDV